MTPISLIQRLHEHRLWIDDRLLAAAESLTDEKRSRAFPIGHGCVFESLVHIFGAERIWLDALHGHSVGIRPHANDFQSFAAFAADWRALHDQWRAHLAQLTDSDLDRPIHRTTSTNQLLTTTAVDVLLHVCTHTMYHAAQVVNMLRHLGQTDLPDTNLITLARRQYPQHQSASVSTS